MYELAEYTYIWNFLSFLIKLKIHLIQNVFLILVRNLKSSPEDDTMVSKARRLKFTIKFFKPKFFFIIKISYDIDSYFYIVN